MVKSFTFIGANVYDNPALLKNNPDYLANLNALHPVERERLLMGNWKIRYEAGRIFSADWFPIIKQPPMMPTMMVRFWDLAGTSREDAGKDTCATSGLLMGQIGTKFYIMDMLVDQWKAGEIINVMKGAASKDGVRTMIRWEQEGGGSAKIVENDFTEELLKANPLYDCSAEKPMGGKLQRALPPATQAQLGNVYLIEGEWNNKFLNAVQSFDGSFKPIINDIVDSLSGAYYVLRQGVNYDIAPPEVDKGQEAQEVLTARRKKYI
jgi:predicted phage terminase large subunit-like protein